MGILVSKAVWAQFKIILEVDRSIDDRHLDLIFKCEVSHILPYLKMLNLLWKFLFIKVFQAKGTSERVELKAIDTIKQNLSLELEYQLKEQQLYIVSCKTRWEKKSSFWKALV